MKINEAEYYQALGHFVHLFSKVEVFLHICFFKIANLPRQTANAIKRQMATKELVSIMRALLPSSRYSEEDRAEMLDVFDQFGRISAFRHSLLHRGADVLGPWMISTNSATSLTPESYEETYFTLEDLQFAINDLGRMQGRIMRLAELSPKEKWLIDDPTLYDAWRYTPVESSMPFQEPPKKTRKPKPQH